MNITLHDKSLDVRLSAAAQKALARRDRPLVAEMELLFSCLLRKRVHFGDAMHESTPVNDRLSVRFRPIMTRRCSVAEGGATPPSEGFPLENPRPYVPNWLTIDFRRGEWVGEFGYAD
ncbi:hypothetical protein [Thiobacillus sedimenti]|uniref:Uncharacterized protein n=1 Tax=Thiobacillus sedimenti TaxID=3110231 RepID=A0ABZ1CKB0_9PROT|nr:hypothetical protein [Thiobacillus sp. SCUT-2]WRS39810.1 hypothetical protein VA613_02790 [Thiobacillus sp. SCUT-2]